MRRWSGVAGIIFVVLAVTARLVEGTRPDIDKADAVKRITTFYANGSHENQALASALLGFIGLFFFLWFLAGLWGEMRGADGRPGSQSGAIVAGGTAFFVFGCLEHLLISSVGVTLKFSRAYHLDPNTTILLYRLGEVAYGIAMIAAGVMVIATGITILKNRLLPQWVAWPGFLLALLALPLIPVLTTSAAILFAIWVLAVSVSWVGSARKLSPA